MYIMISWIVRQLLRSTFYLSLDVMQKYTQRKMHIYKFRVIYHRTSCANTKIKVCHCQWLALKFWSWQLESIDGSIMPKFYIFNLNLTIDYNNTSIPHQIVLFVYSILGVPIRRARHIYFGKYCTYNQHTTKQPIKHGKHLAKSYTNEWLFCDFKAQRLNLIINSSWRA